MTSKFGVSLDDDVAERVEAPLEYGDSRSKRVEELIELGLAVEEAANSAGIDVPDSERDKIALIRQAFLELE